MTDVTIASIEEMEPIYDGLARRARATLGVSARGMQVFTLPPGWAGYPEHNHDTTAFDPDQEEVYIPLAGSATLLAGDEAYALEPGMMARVGPEQAFVRLTAPHRRGLHLHCYRLLGSLHDADDALQETLLRGWRGLDRFEPRAPVSAWLYRIATNVCLRMLEQRGRDPARAEAHLQPYPDRLLEELPSPDVGPDAVVEAREAIGLAFVAAVQLLPPKQRTVLVLRDVLGWSAREVAHFFGDSVAAVNSALCRPTRAASSAARRSSASSRRCPRAAGSTGSGSFRAAPTASLRWRRTFTVPVAASMPTA